MHIEASISPIVTRQTSINGDVVANTQSAANTPDSVDALQLLQSQNFMAKGSGGKSAVGGLPAPKEGAPPQETANHLSTLNGDQLGTDIYAFMALFQKIAQSMRDTARTQRTTELQAQTSELLNAADEMRKAAASRFTAACIQGGFQIATGMLQMGASAMSVRASAKAGASEFEASNATRKAASTTDATAKSTLEETAALATRASKEATNSANTWQNRAQFANSTGTGLGGIVSSFFTQEAGKHDASSAEAQSRAKEHETAAQQASDDMQRMLDIIRDIRDKLQAIEQSAVETNRSIARNI